MFHGRINPFVLDGAVGATLKNFSVNWKRSFHDELLVVSRDEETKSFVVEIDPEKYPYSVTDGNLFSDKYDWQDRMGSNIVFDSETRSPVFNTRDYSVNFARTVQGDFNRLRTVSRSKRRFRRRHLRSAVC